jgi:hypothetical protein
VVVVVVLIPTLVLVVLVVVVQVAIRVLERLVQLTLVVAVVVLQVVLEQLAVLVVQGLLFSATHQITTWLQQVEQLPMSAATRFTRSPLQVITRWWSHEQGCAYSSFDFGWCLGW